MADAGLPRRRGTNSGAVGYVFPAALIVFAFHIAPLFYVTWLSLKTPNGFSFENYRRVLADEAFLRSLRVTLWYAAIIVPLGVAASLALAALLMQVKRGRAFYRAAVFVPFVISTVAAAVVWSWMFTREPWGLANSVLARLGGAVMQWTEESRGIFALLAGPRAPFSGPSLALLVCILFAFWHSLGFNTVIFLAGLSRIPPELKEAARVDGAGAWQTFRCVTLPLLGPTTFFVAAVMTIASFQAFNHVYILAPFERFFSARTVTMHIFIRIYDAPDPPAAAAAAVILFFLVLSLTLVQFLLVARRVHYR